MLWIETALVLASLLLALTIPTLGSRWFEKIEYCFAHLSRRQILSVVLIGTLALALRAAMLPLAPIPEPVVQDEFGYLLSADTFAHGRLTNPTHTMWEHFETFHVIFQPTYASIYPPAPGLLLAVGQLATGSPFWGVWLSIGLMCAAITWMLQAWISAEWALLGGFLAVLRFGVFGYWANGYWGGTVGAFGGALVLGALPRIKRDMRLRHAGVLALGVTVLANTRPYEGLVFVLPVAAALVFWIVNKERRRQPRVQVLTATLCLLLTLSAVATGFYFWRVTGDPFRMPYEVERKNYAVAPYMLWLPPRKPPVYRYPLMRKMFVDQEFIKGYRGAFSPFTFIAKLFWGWSFYLGPALSLPLCMLAIVLPVGMGWRNISQPTRFLLIVFVTSLAGLATETFFHPHYAAPITAALIALMLLAMRRLRAWTWHGKLAGLCLTRLVPVICVLTFTLRAFAVPLHLPRYQFYAAPWYEWTVPTFGRNAIVQRLDALPGRHLVIVRYKPEHQVFFEWVYNDADIDNSKIVWAREMTPAEDQQLIDYFKDRQVWLLQADDAPPQLTKYSVTSLSVAQQQKPE